MDKWDATDRQERDLLGDSWVLKIKVLHQKKKYAAPNVTFKPQMETKISKYRPNGEQTI